MASSRRSGAEEKEPLACQVCSDWKKLVRKTQYQPRRCICGMFP